MGKIFKAWKNWIHLDVVLVFLTVGLYIISGNALTFNFGNRLPLRVADILSFIALAILVFKYRKVFKLSKVSKRLLVFLGIGVVTLLFGWMRFSWSVSQFLYCLLYPVRIAYYIIFLNFAIVCLRERKINFEIVLKFVVWCFIIVCLIGVWQLLAYPRAYDFYKLFYNIGVYFPNPDPHNGRLLSTYFDPNYLGAILLIPLAISTMDFLKNGKWISFFQAVLFFATIIWTVSRSALLGAGIVIAFLFVKYFIVRKNEKRKVNWRVVFATGLLVVYGGLILSGVVYVRVIGRISSTFSSVSESKKDDAQRVGEISDDGKIVSIENENGEMIEVSSEDDSALRVIENSDGSVKIANENGEVIFEKTVKKIDGSTTARFDSWGDGFRLFGENWLLGVGYNAVGLIRDAHSSTAYGFDSSLILILVTTGLIGTVYFAWIFMRYCFKLLSRKDGMSFAIFAILIAVFVVCNFNNLLFYIPFIVPMVLVMGIYEEMVRLDASGVVVDSRMMKHSGITEYIKNMFACGVYDFAIGKKSELSGLIDNVIEFNAGIYGVREQISYPYRRVYALNPKYLHCPHYNIPLFYDGELIVTIHDLTHLKYPEFLPNRFALFYAKFMMWMAVHKSTKILTVSENTKRDILERYGRNVVVNGRLRRRWIFGISAEKIVVIYNAVSDRFVEKERSEMEYLYEKFGISRNKKILLFVGNLKEHKNLKRLLEAVACLKNGTDSLGVETGSGEKVRKKRDDLQLVLVGRSFRESGELKKLEKKLGISDIVVQTGEVSDEELVDLYNLADLFVFPSLYEGFGMPVIEAMKCGTAVACSKSSSLPEVGGKFVTYFGPLNVDEMAAAISEGLSRKISASDKKEIAEWTEKFTVEKIRPEVERIFK